MKTGFEFLQENKIEVNEFGVVFSEKNRRYPLEKEEIAQLLDSYAALKVKECLTVCKAMTEHLDQEERNEYFDRQIDKLK